MSLTNWIAKIAYWTEARHEIGMDTFIITMVLFAREYGYDQRIPLDGRSMSTRQYLWCGLRLKSRSCGPIHHPKLCPWREICSRAKYDRPSLQKATCLATTQLGQCQRDSMQAKIMMHTSDKTFLAVLANIPRPQALPLPCRPLFPHSDPPSQHATQTCGSKS